MNFYELKLEEKTLKLRIQSRHHAELEKLLGTNAIAVMSKEESMMDVMRIAPAVMYIGMKPFAKQQGTYTLDDAYDLYDQMVDEGWDITKFYEMISEVFEVAGFFPKGSTEQMDAEIEKAKQEQDQANPVP